MEDLFLPVMWYRGGAGKRLFLPSKLQLYHPVTNKDIGIGILPRDPKFLLWVFQGHVTFELAQTKRERVVLNLLEFLNGGDKHS